MKSLVKNKWLPFEEAHRIVLKEAKKLGIDGQKKWHQYCSSGKKPINIPRTVHEVYKNQGWKSYGHWLGNGNTRGCSRKYNVNENFFKMWTHDMAYILGFWWADGCIKNNKNSKVFSITQHKKDKYILEEILSKMNSSHPLGKIRNCFEIKIGSKEIVNDIIKLGGCTKKSLKIKFPNVPKEYLRDFVRGYFDGDGCIYKNGKRCCSHFVSGSFNFIKKLNEVLFNEFLKYSNGLKINYSGKIITIPSKIKYIGGKYVRFRKNYRLNFYINDARRLRDFMYTNPRCIKLQRKYEKFLSIGEVKQRGGRLRGSKNKVKTK